MEEEEILELSEFDKKYLRTAANLQTAPIVGAKYNFDKPSIYDENLTIGQNQNLLRKDNQSFGAALGSAVGQSIAEVGLGVVEGAGYLLDLATFGVLLDDGANEFSNVISNFASQQKENVREAIPIFTDPNASLVNNLSDAKFWLANAPQIASSVSLLIPSTGIALGIGKIGTLANLYQ